MRFNKKSQFDLINSNNNSLDGIDIRRIQGNRATVVRGLVDLTDADLDQFCGNFGLPLIYDDGPEVVYEGSTFHEDDIHYDGISAQDPEIMPHWLVFYIEKALKPEFGGQFLIIDSVKALNGLSRNIIAFLRDHKQQFYGYPVWGQSMLAADEFNFEIDCIGMYDGIESLRIHVPIYEDRTEITADGQRVYTMPHNFSLGFSDCDGAEAMDILASIRAVLLQNDKMWTITFQDNDLLIVNNHFAFHGRHGLTQPSYRRMRRRQLLDCQSV